MDKPLVTIMGYSSQRLCHTRGGWDLFSCKIQVVSFFIEVGKYFSSSFSCQNKLVFISANVTKVQSKKLRDGSPAWDGFLEVAGVLEHRCLSEFSKNFTENLSPTKCMKTWEMAILESCFVN